MKRSPDELATPAGGRWLSRARGIRAGRGCLLLPRLQQRAPVAVAVNEFLTRIPMALSV